jgi:hypothetical protein
MIDTAFADRIKKISDADLDAQVSNAYDIAYGKSFGNDHEAHGDAIQEYEMFARERKRRRAASEQSGVVAQCRRHAPVAIVEP